MYFKKDSSNHESVKTKSMQNVEAKASTCDGKLLIEGFMYFVIVILTCDLYINMDKLSLTFFCMYMH